MTVLAGAALDLNGFTLATAEALTLNGTGISSGGALTNSSGTAATYSGLLTLGSSSSIVANSGNIILSATGTVGGSGFGLTLDGTNTASSLASIIGTGAGTVTKTGTGTWTVSGASTFNGQLSVQQGTLSIGTINDAGSNGVLGNSALAVSMGNVGGVTGTLSYTGATTSSTKKFTMATGGTGAFDVTTSGMTLTLSGLIDGSGALSKIGSGTLLLSGSNTFSGTLTIAAGTLSVGTINDAGVAGPLGQSTGDVEFSGGTLLYTGGTDTSSKRFGTRTGNGTIEIGNGTTLTLTGVVEQIDNGSSLTKTGLGTLVLSGVDDNSDLGVIVNTGGGTVVLAKTSNGGTHALGGAGMTLGGGTVQLGGTGGDQLYDFTTVTVNSGTFDFNGRNEAFTVLNGIGGNVLNNGGGASTMTIGVSGNGSGGGSYSGVIANNTSGGGTMALFKTGTGTQTLSGNNTYTGGTNVHQGTLTLDYTTVATKLADTGVLTLSGGTLNLANGATAHTEVVGSTTIAAGASSVTQPSGASILRQNVITRNVGGTVNYAEASIADADGTITVNSIVPWATVASANWATKTTADNAAITAYSAYTTTMPVSGNNSTINYFVIGSDTVSGDLQVNSLKLNTSAASQSLAISSGVTFTLSSNGLLFVGANAYTINGGNLTVGSGVGAYEALVHQYGSAALTISSVIQNNGGNAVSLTKTGTGTLILGGTNTFTGDTRVTQGTLTMNHSSALQNSTLDYNSYTNTTGFGTLSFGTLTSATFGGLKGDQNLALTNGSSAAVALTVGGNTQNTTYSGALSGTGSLVKTGSGVLTLSGANSYTGTTTVSTGTLVINGDQSSATGAVSVTGTLAGTGTVGGATTINNGGTHAPGGVGTVGTQAFSSNLTYASGSIFEWDMAATPDSTGRGTNYDAVNVAGSMNSGSGAIFRVVLNGSQNFSETFWNTAHTWTDIFTADGTNPVSNWTNIFTSVQYYNSTTGALATPSTQGYFTMGGSTLSWTAVPEPSTALAGLLLAAGLLRRRR
ncbi:MAG: autotransporter-associated beta strand repeat-containing protein [Verrucomicrobia bacterium]|nr:autotransporter-associated beta strand repeat-containing protein [Verrucomicrobiota bacterium]